MNLLRLSYSNTKATISAILWFGCEGELGSTLRDPSLPMGTSSGEVREDLMEHPFS